MTEAPEPPRDALSPAAPGDGSSDSPRARFARHLAAHVRTTHDLAWYLDEALPRFGADTEVRLAVEELVDHLGRLMGFAPARVHSVGISCWRAGGACLAIQVLEPVEAVKQVGTWPRVRDALEESGGRDPHLTALFVVCGEPKRRLLEEAVRLRRETDPPRVITAGGLLLLARAVEGGTVSLAAAVALLRPQTALADDLVRLLADPTRP